MNLEIKKIMNKKFNGFININIYALAMKKH